MRALFYNTVAKALELLRPRFEGIVESNVMWRRAFVIGALPLFVIDCLIEAYDAAASAAGEHWVFIKSAWKRTD